MYAKRLRHGLMRGRCSINRVSKEERPMASPQSLGSGQVGVRHQKWAGCLERAESTGLIRPVSLCPTRSWSLFSDHLHLTTPRTCGMLLHGPKAQRVLTAHPGGKQDPILQMGKLRLREAM